MSQPANVTRPASLIFANASSPLVTGRVARNEDNASDFEEASRASNTPLMHAQRVSITSAQRQQEQKCPSEMDQGDSHNTKKHRAVDQQSGSHRQREGSSRKRNL